MKITENMQPKKYRNASKQIDMASKKVLLHEDNKNVGTLFAQKSC